MSTSDAEAEFELAQAEAAAQAQGQGKRGNAPLAGLQGFGQGASLGFSDELAGVVHGAAAAIGRAGLNLTKSAPGRWAVRQAVPALRNAPDAVVDAVLEQAGQNTAQDVGGMRSLPQGVTDAGRQGYTQGRDNLRRDNAQAQEDNPGAYMGGQLAGALAVPLPGPGKATGLAKVARYGMQGTALGAASGLGSSDAQDVGGLARDTALGGALGGAGGALAGGLAVGASRGAAALRARASRGISEAVAAEKQVQQALAEKSTSSALGSFRASVQNAARDLEVLEREAQGSGPMAEKAREFLATPEAQALREGVLANKLKTAPQRLSEMARAEELHAGLQAGQAANVEAQTANALADPVRRQVLPRVWTLGHRMLPIAAAALGGGIGGAGGAAAGGVVGGVLSLTQGLPGRIVKNLAEKPAVRADFWNRVLNAAGGPSGASPGIVRALEQAAQRGPAVFGQEAHRLAASHPEALAIIQALQDQLDGGQGRRTQALKAALTP